MTKQMKRIYTWMIILLTATLLISCAEAPTEPAIKQPLIMDVQFHYHWVPFNPDYVAPDHYEYEVWMDISGECDYEMKVLINGEPYTWLGGHVNGAKRIYHTAYTLNDDPGITWVAQFNAGDESREQTGIFQH